MVHENRRYDIYKAYSFKDTIDLNDYTLLSITSAGKDLYNRLMKLISAHLNTPTSYLYVLIEDPDLLEVTIPMWISMKGIHIYSEVDDLAEIIVIDFLNALLL